jgi:hypothetical protein
MLPAVYTSYIGVNTQEWLINDFKTKLRRKIYGYTSSGF